MRLTCPQCHTEYEVPDAALAGKPILLRCSDCGTKFRAPALPEVTAPPEPAAEIETPAETLPPEEIAAEPEVVFVTEEPAVIEPVIVEPAPEIIIPVEPVIPEPVRPIPAPPRPIPHQAPAAKKPNNALGISILIVLIAIGIALAEHRAIAHAWPPSLRLFNALGLH